MKINQAISQAVSRAFEDFHGPATEQALIDIAINELSGEFDSSELLKVAVSGEVHKQKRIRSIEKQEEDSGDLFSESLSDKLLTYREGNDKYVIKLCDAQLEHHIQFREKQIKNIRTANRSFDRWEQRREIIIPIMQKNPSLTTSQALELSEQPA